MPRGRRRRGFLDYRYKPLDSRLREIRLIRLQPSSLIRDVIKCEIENFDVDKVPDYEAISYAWGKAADVAYIRVGRRH